MDDRQDPPRSAPRKPRIERLQTAETPKPEPRPVLTFGGPESIAREAGPAVHRQGPTREFPQQTGPALRKRGGLLRSPIALLAIGALILIAALFGYQSSQLESESETSETSDSDGVEILNMPAEEQPYRESQTPPAPPVEQPAEVSSVEEISAADVRTPATDLRVPAPQARAPETQTRAPERQARSPEREARAPEREARAPAPVDAPEPAAPDVAAAPRATSALPTVRAFYAALSNGDGASAAQWVIPQKRQSGPLSARALTRYFSSFREPLRVRRATQVDEDTVRVAYDYVLADGRSCAGQAAIDVVQRGGRTLISRIRSRGPC